MSDIRARAEELVRRAEAATDAAERSRLLLAAGELLCPVAPGEACAMLERAVDLAIRAGESRLAVRAASAAAEVCEKAGDLAGVFRLAQVMLVAAHREEDVLAEVGALNLLGRLHYFGGRQDRAQECYEQGLKLSRAAGFREGIQSSRNQLACLHGTQGRYGEALALYRDCLHEDEAACDRDGLAYSCYNTGWCLRMLGRWDEARAQLYRAVEFGEARGPRDVRLDALNVLGEIALVRDEPARAVELFGDVVRSERAEGVYPRVLRDALCNLGWALLRAGDLAAAGAALAEAEVLSRAAADLRQLAIALRLAAEVALAAGREADCERAAEESLALAVEHGFAPERVEALRVRALAAARRGDPDGAARLFGQATGAAGIAPGSYEAARARRDYGRWRAETGDRGLAEPLLAEAAAAFERLGAVAEYREAATVLARVRAANERESGLVDGMRALAGFGLEPVSFVEHALGTMAEALEFPAGAVCVAGCVVAARGGPNRLRVLELAAAGETAVGGREVCLPVAKDGVTLGAVVLLREADGPVAVKRAALEAAAGRLAGALALLARRPFLPGDESIVPGLVFAGIVGRNRAMLNALQAAASAAWANLPVLVRGESGTGKELVARALHDSGPRAKGPFVAVNCAAVPTELFEVEFFGVEAGTATGVSARAGKLELADGGTVFLDEVGEMSPALQAKLLRVLEGGLVTRVGGRSERKVDVRIVAATNQELDALRAQGRFRNDLYYRLQGVELVLPPLRERREDIPALARLFLARARAKREQVVLGPTEDFMSAVLSYRWPGNVRELANAMERAVLLSTGPVVTADQLPQEVRAALARPLERELVVGAVSTPLVRRRLQREEEKKLVEESMARAGGNATRAAKLAGYSRSQFYHLMNRHGLTSR